MSINQRNYDKPMPGGVNWPNVKPTATHTPTPWSVCPKECGGIGVANMDGGVFRKPRETVAITAHGNTREGWHYVAAMNDHEESTADADFIVRACNAHDELLDLNQELAAALGALMINKEHGECEAMHPDLADEMARAAVKRQAAFRAALAKAGAE